MRFVQAYNYKRANRRKSDITLAVVHCTQGPETPGRDANTAAWFADKRSAGSTHYVVSPSSTTQCVLEKDIAIGANGPSNRIGIHVELNGRAEQTIDEWFDPPEHLERAAELFADICFRNDIPPLWLTADELLDGATGITGHAECSLAWGGDHYDPGEDFPRETFAEMVAERLDKLNKTVTRIS